MFHEYPYTDFHELNLDWLMGELRKYTGLKLAVAGDKLSLVNDKGEVINSVTISYAEKALNDVDGNPIKSYIINAGTSGDYLLFTKGDGTAITIQVPYANKAKYDIDNHEIEDYVYNVQVAGNKLRITKGDGTIAEITVPYATSATNDDAGNDIKTYACELEVDGNELVLRDRAGRQLDRITVHYAEEATHANTADEADHAVEADHADVATDATNAIETVAVDGDLIKFTTYGGTVYAITPNYAVKALKDDLGNTIKGTYYAGVSIDPDTGAISFYDAQGNVVDTIIPMAKKATNDSYNNLIADYVKTIVVSADSDYVTVTHGTGDVDTLQINYSNRAWKDTNDNVIKNTYYKHCECVIDPNDHHFKIVAYNGDNPMAEIERFEVKAYMAQVDINEKDLTSYVADVDYNASKQIAVKDGAGNNLKTLANKLNNVADVNINNALADGQFLAYDASSDEWVNAEMQVALDDLTDVDTSGVADGDVIKYDANSKTWVVGQAGSTVPKTDVAVNFGTWNKSTGVYTPTLSFSSSYWTNDSLTLDANPVITFDDGDKRVCQCVTWLMNGSIFDNEDYIVPALVNIAKGYDTATYNIEAYFEYPEDSSKQIKVTMTIDGSTKTISNHTATLVSVGGGASTPKYVVLGNWDTQSNTYTAASTSSITDAIIAGDSRFVITRNNAIVLLPVVIGIMESNSQLPVIKTLEQLVELIKSGLVPNDIYEINLQFINTTTDDARYNVSFVINGSMSILQNHCQKLVV